MSDDKDNSSATNSSSTEYTPTFVPISSHEGWESSVVHPVLKDVADFALAQVPGVGDYYALKDVAAAGKAALQAKTAEESNQAHAKEVATVIGNSGVPGELTSAAPLVWDAIAATQKDMPYWSDGGQQAVEDAFAKKGFGGGTNPNSRVEPVIIKGQGPAVLGRDGEIPDPVAITEPQQVGNTVIFGTVGPGRQTGSPIDVSPLITGPGSELSPKGLPGGVDPAGLNGSGLGHNGFGGLGAPGGNGVGAGGGAPTGTGQGAGSPSGTSTGGGISTGSVSGTVDPGHVDSRQSWVDGGGTVDSNGVRQAPADPDKSAGGGEKPEGGDVAQGGTFVTTKDNGNSTTSSTMSVDLSVVPVGADPTAAANAAKAATPPPPSSTPQPSTPPTSTPDTSQGQGQGGQGQGQGQGGTTQGQGSQGDNSQGSQNQGNQGSGSKPGSTSGYTDDDTGPGAHNPRAFEASLSAAQSNSANTEDDTSRFSHNPKAFGADLVSSVSAQSNSANTDDDTSRFIHNPKADIAHTAVSTGENTAAKVSLNAFDHGAAAHNSVAAAATSATHAASEHAVAFNAHDARASESSAAEGHYPAGLGHSDMAAHGVDSAHAAAAVVHDSGSALHNAATHHDMGHHSM